MVIILSLVSGFLLFFTGFLFGAGMGIQHGATHEQARVKKVIDELNANIAKLESDEKAEVALVVN